jgi:hypothetical protein
MTENFLISESLKGTVTKENLYIDNVNLNSRIVPIVKELRVDSNYVEIDIIINNIELSSTLNIEKIILDEREYTFKETLSFSVKRIFYDNDKNIAYTIVIREELFWRSL